MYSMKKYLLLFLCLTLGVAYAQDTLRVRVMTYNLRFGELASLEELAHHIKSFKPDLVALQEVDSKTDRKRTPHQKGKDFISELAYHTGMFGLYGKTIDYSTGYYGIGMLSKYPYISVQKIMLPGNKFYLLRPCFLRVDVQMRRGKNNGIITHFE